MRSQDDKQGTWEVLRLGCQLFVVTLVVALAAAACAALVGCSAFKGPAQTYGKAGVGTEAPHNINPMVGLGREWETGAAVEVRYEPRLRVDEPSSRGFPEALGRVFGELKVPLGR